MEGRTPIKLWTTSPEGDVPVEDKALAQLRNIASLPFVFRHVAAMPDVHLGMGAATSVTAGSSSSTRRSTATRTRRSTSARSGRGTTSSSSASTRRTGSG